MGVGRRGHPHFAPNLTFEMIVAIELDLAAAVDFLQAELFA